MAKAYIGIGSNVGDRRAHMAAAKAGLAAIAQTHLAGFSDVYETPPVGPVEQGDFLNAVAAVDTQLSPRDLLAALHAIERAAGRDRATQTVRWGPRPLDMDILLYDQQVIDEPGLSVPHPRMHERWFVLKPLVDLAPDTVHPVLGRTVADLLADVKP